ncbi:MAG: ABC transporter permease [Oscillospiraceae bacterium]|jgi:D-methionine transport system permease protein|nr:ABC transporter permease [Oscillospiraceae bacterium]
MDFLSPKEIEMIQKGILETLYMTSLSTLFAYFIGLPLGVVLAITGKGGLKRNPVIYSVLGFIVNVLRSAPFLILLVTLIPFTRLIVGTSIGSTATIVPLTIAAFPFIARLVESSLKEVDSGVVEAADSMGSTRWQIIWKVLLPEARSSLLLGVAIATTTILSYSAMAGFVGGGGLGDIAIRFGYYRWQQKMMLITVILLIIIVQIIQELGLFLSKKLNKKRSDG